MEFAHWDPRQEQRRLYRSLSVALGLEALFFLALGLSHLPFFHSRFDSADYVEAQILQLPAQSHLTGAQAVKDDDDIVYNPHHRAKPVKKAPPKAPEQNQVDAGPSLGPTHGPVALYAPSPVIPQSLRGQDLRTNVVIEFLVTAQGQVTPRLLQSSGNDDLDALALETVKQWRFAPAAQNNVPADSKTRLRILFQVQ